MIDPAVNVLPLLACPHDALDLNQEGRVLRCRNGHAFPIVQGVPVLLRSDVPQTIGLASDSLRLAWAAVEGSNDDPWFIETLGIAEQVKRDLRVQQAGAAGATDPVVSYLIGATNGILYKHLVGSLREYPIPEIRLPIVDGKRLLDIGCNWGRWCFAAARRGYVPVGIDPSLGAVLAAKRVAQSLGLPFEGVVGDTRFLPFRSKTFDVTFSYSVLQHFSKADACTALREMRRVLSPDGSFLVQMASAFGLRSLQHQIKRGFREPIEFEVRYWTPGELLEAFHDTFGATQMEVDCYFGLGLQMSDLQMMGKGKRAIIYCSEGLRRLSRFLRPLSYLADSLYFRSAAGRM